MSGSGRRASNARASISRIKELDKSPSPMRSSGEYMKLTKVEAQMLNLKKTVTGSKVVRRRISMGLASNSPRSQAKKGSSRNDRTTSREHADVSPDVVERDLPNSIHKSKVTNQKMPEKHKLMIKSTS